MFSSPTTCAKKYRTRAMFSMYGIYATVVWRMNQTSVVNNEMELPRTTTATVVQYSTNWNGLRIVHR